MRTIVVEYVLSTERVSMDVLSKLLNIEPFEIRSSFPEGSIAKPYWSTSISSSKNNIEEPLQALVDVLSSKREVIDDVVHEWQVSSSIIVKVRADYFDRPELVIPSHQLRFFADIHAELEFDIAYDW